MWSQQDLDGENKSVMCAQLNQVSGPLKEIKLSPERGHLMRGRLADSDEWRVTPAECEAATISAFGLVMIFHP